MTAVLNPVELVDVTAEYVALKWVPAAAERWLKAHPGNFLDDGEPCFDLETLFNSVIPEFWDSTEAETDDPVAFEQAVFEAVSRNVWTYMRGLVEDAARESRAARNTMGYHGVCQADFL